jgi:hypothetical protein
MATARVNSFCAAGLQDVGEVHRAELVRGLLGLGGRREQKTNEASHRKDSHCPSPFFPSHASKYHRSRRN